MEVNYPSEIEQTVLALAECNRQSAELRERLTATESIITQDIAAAKNAGGQAAILERERPLRRAYLTVER